MGKYEVLNDQLNQALNTTEQQIVLLEKKIDDLKAEYILFFNGETRMPPEKKREDLERTVRKLIYGGAKTARMDMIIQNLVQRFNLYNNLWLKRLNELECGTPLGRKNKIQKPAPPPKPEKAQREVYLTLNDENTFERLVDAYRELFPNGIKSEKDRGKIIDGMKAKMLTHNLVEARVTFAVQGGKLNIKIKK